MARTWHTQLTSNGNSQSIVQSMVYSRVQSPVSRQAQGKGSGLKCTHPCTTHTLSFPECSAYIVVVESIFAEVVGKPGR